MNHQRPDVPIIGQQQRVLINDHRIIAPNTIELTPNGYGMGDSVATLRVIDPLNARIYHVPLIRAQLDEMVRASLEILGAEYDADKRED